MRTLPGPSGTRFFEIRWFDVIDSTNRYLLDEAADGAPSGLVAVADHQTAGRGRRGRVWDSKPGASLLASVLLRPGDRSVGGADLPLGLLPQAYGLAVVDACQRIGGFTARLKWPNDVLVGERKLAGVLAEVQARAGQVAAVVVGCGMNLNWGPDLPVGIRARSISADEAAGRAIDPPMLLDAVLASLDGWLSRPDEVTAAYRSVCATIGRRVRVELPADEVVEGFAAGVADDGALLVESDEVGLRRFSIGDVVHLRQGGAAPAPA